jgi:hypothetical protein
LIRRFYNSFIFYDLIQPLLRIIGAQSISQNLANIRENKMIVLDEQLLGGLLEFKNKPGEKFFKSNYKD